MRALHPVVIVLAFIVVFSALTWLFLLSLNGQRASDFAIGVAVAMSIAGIVTLGWILSRQDDD